jgi:flagellar hook-associated protein FlgK
MKNTVKSSVFILLAILAASCSSDSNDDNPMDTAASVEAVSNLATSGTWRISSFIDSGTDETNDFTGYSFSFNSDGSLVADNGTAIITGTWSITSDDSSDDSDDYDSSDDIDFNILFSAPPDFAELSDDWDIVFRSDTRIELIDISGGNGGTDTLTFQKN